MALNKKLIQSIHNRLMLFFPHGPRAPFESMLCLSSSSILVVFLSPILKPSSHSVYISCVVTTSWIQFLSVALTYPSDVLIDHIPIRNILLNQRDFLKSQKGHLKLQETSHGQRYT